jgi:DNA-binding transcriptional MerR regulator
MKSKCFKITEFSRLTGLSIKALRLYDKLEILVPARFSINGYRHYEESQVKIANFVHGDFRLQQH